MSHESQTPREPSARSRHARRCGLSAPSPAAGAVPRRRRRASPLRRITCPAILAVLAVLAVCSAAGTGCESSVEDHVDELCGAGQDSQQAQQALLLTRRSAVEPLLTALRVDRSCAPALVPVLFSLWMRLDDERIGSSLAAALSTDPDAGVRRQVARLAGTHQRVELVEPLFSALSDEAGDVRAAAAVALTGIAPRMTQAQRSRLDAASRAMAADPHPGVQLEGEILLERRVEALLSTAEGEVLGGRLAVAESLLWAAVEHHPGSPLGQYRLGRFHFDNGRAEEGLARLRAHGLLVDVPHVRTSPVVDGRLDEASWARASAADAFVLYVHAHRGAPPCVVDTRWHALTTDTALYLGFWGHDERPADLVAVAEGETADWAAAGEPLFRDDSFECFLDPNFDRTSYAHFAVNSKGALADKWATRPGEQDRVWDSDVEIGTHVGSDFWSVEMRVPYDGERFPRPGRDTLWGVNVMRGYRSQEKCQWVRTTRGGHTPDQFGLLRFVGRVDAEDEG